ncbi:hypothetical protein LTR37_009630 [Vermiconidia calcicola]|uniref:Uncharacterized protein n=1 Tax=Vermiconidia calcicola TaxID=1690605 RepID=A0ACC3N757_9PEZI|nr:hypothetical protein LTR37_009630 [Vermiconidia calcicola]
MSDTGRPSDDKGKQLPVAIEQLATPALSPISEHGDHETQPLPSYEANAAEGNGGAGSKKANGYPGLSIQTNHAIDHKPGQNSVSSPKTSKLSPTQLQELVQSPESLPVRALKDAEEDIPVLTNRQLSKPAVGLGLQTSPVLTDSAAESSDRFGERSNTQTVPEVPSISATPGAVTTARPSKVTRSAPSPLTYRQQSSSKPSKPKPQLAPLNTEDGNSSVPIGNMNTSPPIDQQQPSPMPAFFPVPPLSLPTYLQLELSSDGPSALYIHRSIANEFPYESAKIKFERLLNFLLLPPQLEQVLWFGAIACLDAWLYTFTILPLRFLKAIAILATWGAQNVAREVHFVYSGVGRVWQRRRQSSVSNSRRPSLADNERSRAMSVVDLGTEATPRLNGHALPPQSDKRRKTTSGFRHRRSRSTPSALLPNHKADILQGLLIAASCTILMWFDASRMYHSIRGQAAIKLYVIYNVLEVFDRLFSALGQDVLECLFSKETLERDERGRSKIIRPMWMFLLALVYNVVHATALFYQVVTLNVAVNSYSNALLTLLMSNQFVEIKGTVFKKFEKENLFQLTCADVVERFQLWLMLLIIALRNIVEVGGLSISLNSSAPSDTLAPNATGIPLSSGFIIPKAFTIMPKWTGELLGPFLIVLGSEALVDWCKHAYISKFNNVKPNIYGRFLDVLAKDYYSHAFADQNLTKRLGLPVIPLSCLFIRACMQTYHMFLATHMPLPIPSPATSISVESPPSSGAAASPATTAALQHIDHVFRRALGRSSFGAGGGNAASYWWNLDDIIAFATMTFFFLALYLVLLALKLVLGMALLSFARNRYKGMKDRERQSSETQGKRVGGWGVVEVNEDKRRWIYEDDAEGLQLLRERGRKKEGEGGRSLEGVKRYGMVAKRIW